MLRKYKIRGSVKSRRPHGLKLVSDNDVTLFLNENHYNKAQRDYLKHAKCDPMEIVEIGFQTTRETPFVRGVIITRDKFNFRIDYVCPIYGEKIL